MKDLDFEKYLYAYFEFYQCWQFAIFNFIFI